MSPVTCQTSKKLYLRKVLPVAGTFALTHLMDPHPTTMSVDGGGAT
ncbi:hypothetical protein [Spirosoma aerophilum]